MPNALYRKEEYIIFRVGADCIVYNTSKPFEKGHSHLKSVKAGIDAITFCLNKTIPNKARKYYLQTLYRISDDPQFQQQILAKLEPKLDQNFDKSLPDTDKKKKVRKYHHYKNNANKGRGR